MSLWKRTTTKFGWSSERVRWSLWLRAIGVKLWGSRRSREAWLGVALAMPAYAVVFWIILRPLLENIWLSLHKLDLLSSPDPVFIGLTGIVRVLSYPDVQKGLTNSFILTGSSVAIQFVLAFGIALLLQKDFRGQGTIQTLYMLPWAIPTIVAAFVFRIMFDAQFGMVNSWLLGVGLIRTSINFLDTPLYSMGVLILAHVWKGFPFELLILLAGLKTIPSELYDAAKVDGASYLDEVRHITLPSLGYIIAIAITLRTIWFFNWFDLVWLLNSGGPARMTETIPLTAYLTAFREFKMGDGAAISVIMFVILLALCILFFRATAESEEV